MASVKEGCKALRRTVLITGVSRGCGRALAVELARRGHTVIGIARSEDKLESLREECPMPNGQPHFFTAVDVTSDAGVKELAQRIVEDGLVPDIIVNNAGIINQPNKIFEVSPVEVDVLLDTNIKGTINIIRHFLPLLIGRGHGVVVNMSSIWGRTVVPKFSPYCMTKWAIEGLSRAIAMEVPPGLAVVALDPGSIHTGMLVTCFGSMAARFSTPQEWAPAAVDMILSFTTKDNGASPTIQMGEKKTVARDALLKDRATNDK